MDGLDRREATTLRVYSAVTVLATALWWAGLAASDTVRRVTIGSAIGPDGFGVLLLADVLSAGVLPVMVLFARSKALLSFLLAAHFGGQAYAWLVSIGCAVHDPAAYPGLVAMTLSAGAAFAFALRTSGVSVLWGPFRFGTAASSDPGTNWRRTVAQTAGMWAVFLVAVPGAVVVLESVFRWRQPWSPAPAVDVLAGLAFIAAGATGLWAGKRFCVDGDGTPLPSDGTRRLVVSGPYRYIRNPMALFGILQGVCIGVVLRSPLVVTYAVVGGVWWDVLARPLEERYLADTFGDDYGEYRDRVRCWIPHLSALRARSLREGPKCGR